jgi:hypothetical protein
VDWVCIIFCCPCYSRVVPTCITGGRILLVVYQGAPTNHGYIHLLKIWSSAVLLQMHVDGHIML